MGEQEVKGKAARPKRNFAKALAGIFAGALVGGGVAYQAENAESERFMQRADEEIEALKSKADPLSEKWDELHGTILSYRFYADSLQREVRRYADMYKKLVDAVNSDSDANQELFANANQEIEALKEELAELGAERARADSLERFIKLWNEALEDTLEAYVKKVRRDSLEQAGAIQSSRLRIAELEKTVEDLQGDIGTKAKGRYTMKEEFSLVFECIFGSRRNYYNLSQSEYAKLADCCVKSVQQVQEQFPKISDFRKIESSLNIRCPSYEDDE